MTQAIPPDTSNFYMAMGYAAVFLLVFLMLAYFANRARRLRSELAMLTELDAETTKSGDPVPAASDDAKQPVR